MLLDERFDLLAAVFFERAGDDDRLAGERAGRRGGARLERRRHVDAGFAEAVDGALAVLAVEEAVDARGDHRADFFDFGELLVGGGQQRVHRAEVAGERRGDAGADVADREGVEQPGEAAGLAGLDVGDELLGRLLAHALQLGELLVGEVVEVGEVVRPGPLSTSWSASFSPRPSMSIAERLAK